MFKKILKILGIILGGLVSLVIILFLVLTIFEYKPKDIEALTVNNNQTEYVHLDTDYRIVTWNVGYGALGDNADFFMDGGSGVYTSTKKRIKDNIDCIQSEINSLNPDFIFLQEVDQASSRSRYVDEVSFFANSFNNYSYTFTLNYKVLFVPIPFPPMAKVKSGIMSFSKFEVIEASRYALPCPFSWPVSVANLKRGLSIQVHKIEGSEKLLYMINFHLEAYDDGEGKIAQTKVLVDLLESIYANGNYAIAGGDFNQILSSVDINKYEVKEGLWTPGVIDVSGFTDFNAIMDETSPTCRSLDKPYVDANKETFQYYLIDGFLVSKNIEINDYKTINLNFEWSDHNPVILDFKLK